MGCSEKRIAVLLLEIISLMGKRYVQREWPSLIPELIENLNSGNINSIKLSLEAIKKICKKYRYMFRSDELYTEMNYMIEHLSPLLIQNLMVSPPQSLTRNTFRTQLTFCSNSNQKELMSPPLTRQIF